MNQLYTWLESKNYFTKSKDVPIPSHLLYDGYKGGKLYIPRAKEYDFLTQYAKSMSDKTQFIVETRPKTFKFMIDVDISDDHYWSMEEIVKLTDIIQKTVYAFFETNQITICCTSPAKTKSDGIHTGIHLIWPTLFVMSDTALCIRRGIIQKIKENNFKLTKSWEDIIDETIFTRNGYRMVGSDKIKVVKENGIERKIPEDRPLKLLFTMDSEGQLNNIYYERLKNDTKALILETSIRYVIDTYLNQGMNLNKIPIWLEDDPLQKKAGPKNSGAGVVVSGKEHILIENFIRKHLPKQYSRQIVKAVTRYSDGNLLIKTNSKFCMNLGREHNSCGIYFFASPQGIKQKCLCPCNKLDDRKNGLCMDYSSEYFEFDKDTQKVLFPEYEENLFIKKQKKKKETKFIPSTKANLLSQQQQICDKMFKDIMSKLE